MILKKPSEVDFLENYYITNYTAALYYKHAILYTKKSYLKKLFKALYRHKKALKDDLDKHILAARDQRYLDKLIKKSKYEVQKMHEKLSSSSNIKSGRICTEVENHFLNQLQQTLSLITDGNLRDMLLSHKYKAATLRDKLTTVSKYLI
ncbi:MAG TPA: hypothetical protein VJ899_00185 [Salegentibacter sp.]|nr:hypothetical protein [Salegentibacter sp.]